MKIATDIKTELWNTIIQKLLNENWICVFKYDNFDAGIDADFVILEKDKEEILFSWDNWFEGEIKCSEFRMLEIEKSHKIKFSFGKTVNLQSDVIQLHRKWKEDKIMNNPGLLKKKTWWKF